MDSSIVQFQLPVISKSIIIIVGGYGSGKSEVSVNLARHFVASQASPGKLVSIVDLDIVNPYFRSREAAKELRKLGINTINPEGSQFYADLPIVLPEIKGVIEHNKGITVLDVGGDDVGARVLSSLASAFLPGTYALLLVLNANRPFTATVDGCLKIIEEIEAASRLKLTGLISNSHLMDKTTAATIVHGLKLCHQVGKKTKLPVQFLSVTQQDLEKVDPELIDVPVLPMIRSLLKPWEK